MSEEDKLINVRVMTWNVGFGSSKPDFIPSDQARAQAVLKVVQPLEIDLIALQEMANRTYSDQGHFSLKEFIEQNDEQLQYLHFQPAVSLGRENSYPYGKLAGLTQRLKIIEQQAGPGIWIRFSNGWHLRNLYAEKMSARPYPEIQRPLPHPLYMGENPPPPGLEADRRFSAGRDEEDRPVIWSRVGNDSSSDRPKLFLLALHLPTLKGEEQNKPPGDLTKSQQNLAERVLRLPAVKLHEWTVDQLGTEIRLYYLQQIMAQIKRMQEFWQGDDEANKCVFILAGDFNFYHSNGNNSPRAKEEQFLSENNFVPAKTSGLTRPFSARTGERLVDNIWVKGAESVREIDLRNYDIRLVDNNHSAPEIWNTISDHYPVIADIEVKF